MGKLPDKPAVVYAIRCSKTGRVYIGSTTNLQYRIDTHFRELKKRDKRAILYGEDGRGIGVTPNGSIWQKDYDDYGRDAFDVYILEENVQKKDRPDRENFWMEKYKALDPRYGYNLHWEKPPKHKVTPGLPPLPPDD